MKVIGCMTRALVIEALAVGAIMWFAAGGPPRFETASRDNLERTEAAQAGVTKVDRSALVQSKLERVALALRSEANQLVDEALATWFGK